MAEARTREDIARDYRAARAAGDHPATARLQNEEACHVLLALMERLAADDGSFISLSNLAGAFGAAGGSLDIGVGAEGSVWGGADVCGRIVNGVSLGATAGGGGSAYAAGQDTIVLQLWGPPDEPCQAKSQVNRP
jgi:hypothetical protein